MELAVKGTSRKMELLVKGDVNEIADLVGQIQGQLTEDKGLPHCAECSSYKISYDLPCTPTQD